MLSHSFGLILDIAPIDRLSPNTVTAQTPQQAFDRRLRIKQHLDQFHYPGPDKISVAQFLTD